MPRSAAGAEERSRARSTGEAVGDAAKATGEAVEDAAKATGKAKNDDLSTDGPNKPLKEEPTLKGSPTSSYHEVDKVLKSLEWGHIAFNVPETMNYREPYPIELLLSPSLSIGDLQKRLGEVAGLDSATIRIANRMEAKLTGEDFSIEALTPELQAVGGGLSRWRWKVIPTSPGSQLLHLSLSAHIDVEGHDAPCVVETFQRAIRVKITAGQWVLGFVQRNWQWAWTGLSVPIAGYLWNLRRRLKRPAVKRRKHLPKRQK